MYTIKQLRQCLEALEQKDMANCWVYPGRVRPGRVRPGRVRPGRVRPGRVRPGRGRLNGEGSEHVLERVRESHGYDATFFKEQKLGTARLDAARIEPNELAIVLVARGKMDG